VGSEIDIFGDDPHLVPDVIPVQVDGTPGNSEETENHLLLVFNNRTLTCFTLKHLSNFPKVL